MSINMIIDLITLGNYIAKKYNITIKKNVNDNETEIELLLIDIHDNEIKGSIRLYTKDRYIASVLGNFISMFRDFVSHE
jgi:hypothetical protein